MKAVYLIVLVALLAIIGIAVYSNMGMPPIKMKFLNNEMEAHGAMVIGGSYLLGALTGGVLFSFIRRSLHKITEEPQQVGPDGKPKDPKKKK